MKDKLGADLNQLEMYPIKPPDDEGLRQSVVSPIAINEAWKDVLYLWQTPQGIRKNEVDTSVGG